MGVLLPKHPRGSPYTFFLRERAGLDVIKNEVFAPARTKKRKVAICTVGCSTGEEAYTLALLAHESGVHANILATDVNKHSLDVAEKGSYGNNSLQNLSMSQRMSWFEKDDGYRTVKPILRKHIRFLHHDISTEVLPRPTDLGWPGARGWDVILCRNVLIYLDNDAALSAIRTIASALATDGLFVHGLAERVSASVREAVPLELVEFAGTLVYQKRVGYSPPTAPAVPDYLRVETHSQAAAKPAPSRASRQTEPAPLVDADVLRERGDELLNDGAYSEAIERYQEALLLQAHAPCILLRLATAQIAQSNIDGAIHTLRRCLFLAPKLWPASYMLAELLFEENPTLALRYYLQAESALRYPPDMPHDERLAQFLIAPKIALRAVCLRRDFLLESTDT